MPDANLWSAGRRVSVAGLLRGRELAGEAMVTLEDDGIVLAVDRRRLVLPLAALEGACRTSGDTLELYLSSGDAIHLSGDAELEALASELTRRVCTVPELTRSLRTLGSRRAAPGPEHDRFFETLLAARREAERAASPDAARAAFDAPALRAAIAHRLREFAAERYPNEPPERRALEAELLECAEGLLARLADLERAQGALAACGDGERFHRWRSWASALRAVFESSDACWLAMHAVLTPERRGRPSRWRLRSRGRRP